MSALYVSLSREGDIKLNKHSPSSRKTTASMIIRKPDPTAVVAKTESDHHIKAESLRRTNEKIDAIEKCIASDTGAEVHIRQDIAENQRVIDDVKQKKAELDKIMHQAEEAVEKGEEEMKRSKDQRRETHSVELGQLVEEQRTGFEELKKSEGVLHAELTKKIQGYKMTGQSLLFEARVALTP